MLFRSRLLWLDESWRNKHPERDPEVVHADYTAWANSTHADKAVS